MDSHIQTDYNMVSQLALRVALQTMKERCLSLQQRLSSVEEENQSLRGRLDSDKHHNSLQETKSLQGNSIEVDNLRSQVSELSRQKVQLSDHINMVANENRKLWSRLSQIAKEQQEDSNVNQKSKNDQPILSHSIEDDLDNPKGSQNLIRSRTFTQHAPNPNLRLKVIDFENTNKDHPDDPSLEEVLLVEASDDDSSNRELKSDDMIGMCETELGFTYLNVTTDPEDEFNIEARKCLEGLHKIKQEVLQQQLDMSSTFSTLENRFVLQGCSVCAENAQKPEMVDKSLETDESIADLSRYMLGLDVDGEEDDDVEDVYDEEQIYLDEDNAQAQATGSPTQMDFDARKLKADKEIKVCPMCGSVFDHRITFDQFREHVESHFLENPVASDPTNEHNFELISHTVGDF